ncbi:MAG: DUF4453 domain-containing protein [Marinovum sp.]|nr:DUF4453 domain-containing protein [Marinovum sp.]
MWRSFSALALAASPALADPDICAEYWYSRNAIFNYGGYCFGSALGQAEFDNSDCIPGPPALSESDAVQVTQIRTYEDHFDCAVNTGTQSIAFSTKPLLSRLIDLPVRGFDGSVDDPVSLEFTAACINYLGPTPIALRAGTTTDTPIIGAIKPGDDVITSHHGLNGWTYLTARGPGDQDSGGWTSTPFASLTCEGFAG